MIGLRRGQWAGVMMAHGSREFEGRAVFGGDTGRDHCRFTVVVFNSAPDGQGEISEKPEPIFLLRKFSQNKK